MEALHGEHTAPQLLSPLNLAFIGDGVYELLVREHLLGLGNRPVGKNRFRVTASSETWDVIYNQGELARAKLTLTLEEYA